MAEFQASREVASSPHWSYHELAHEVDGLRDQLDQVDDAQLLEQERVRQRTELIDQFAADIQAHPERFRHVFRTEHGSLYATLASGETVRIKQSGEHRLQPITKHIVFLNESDAQAQEQQYRSEFFQERIIGQTLKDAGCAVGNTPFEFGVVGFPDQQITQHAGEVTILGDAQGSFASGMHLGHRITEIVT